jgi:hypothetical protein
MGGWSRGGDDAREACEVCREMGVPVRFLFLIDPVPAYGWKALLRVVPFAPLQRVYTAPGNILEASPAYPLGGGIAQVLAGEEHSRILRRALIQGVPTRYVMGDHSDSGWRSEDTDDFVVEQGARYGVVFDPLDRTTVAQALGLYGGGAT